MGLTGFAVTVGHRKFRTKLQCVRSNEFCYPIIGAKLCVGVCVGSVGVCVGSVWPAPLKRGRGGEGGEEEGNFKKEGESSSSPLHDPF